MSNPNINLASNLSIKIICLMDKFFLNFYDCINQNYDFNKLLSDFGKYFT